MNLIYRSFVHDLLYMAADAAIKRENPCNIHTDIEGTVVCTYDGPCCGGCEHLSGTGCTVRCLRCKLFLCSCIFNYANIDTKLRNVMSGALKIAGRYNLNWMRYGREQAMNNLRRRHMMGWIK